MPSPELPPPRPERPARRVGSFRGRVAGVSLLITTLTLAVAFGLFAARQWRVERQSMAERRAVLANVMAANASSALIFGDGPTAERILRSARGIPDVRGVSIYTAKGELFARYRDPVPPPAPGDPIRSWRFTHDTLEVHAPVLVDRERIGDLVLVSTLDGLHKTFLSYALFAVLLFLSVTSVALWAATWLARRLMLPVERLSRAMHEITQSGDFSQPVERASDQELAVLTDEFNTLLSTLGRSMRDLMEARDAAETANRLKTEFLANMSHEIRTPLNGVLGMAQIMAADELPDAQRQRLSVVQQSGANLLSILNDVLDVAKIEAGELELVVGDFSPSSVVREAAEPFAAMAHAKGVEFELSIDGRAGGVWAGDEVRFRQIVANLVSNAVKFTRSGRVGVTLAADATDALTLAVTDTGVGIPPEQRPHLFERFTQADASATREFGGTGLGLAICRDLVQLMDGELQVESRPGEGSEFRVRLPLRHVRDAGPAAAASSPLPQPRADGRRARLLAAEDNHLNATILKLLAEMLGYDLDVVGDGRAAVDAWSAGAYDLVLMDIQMPGLDGVAATKLIRAAEAAGGLPRTPVVALTANVMSHQVREYLAAGMDDYVAKPIDAETLRAAIIRALSGGAVAPLAESA